MLPLNTTNAWRSVWGHLSPLTLPGSPLRPETRRPSEGGQCGGQAKDFHLLRLFRATRQNWWTRLFTQMAPIPLRLHYPGRGGRVSASVLF